MEPSLLLTLPSLVPAYLSAYTSACRTTGLTACPPAAPKCMPMKGEVGMNPLKLNNSFGKSHSVCAIMDKPLVCLYVVCLLAYPPASLYVCLNTCLGIGCGRVEEPTKSEQHLVNIP